MQLTDDSGNSRRTDFEELALPHMSRLYGVALSLTRNPQDAEDLVQDTYLKAYRFFHRFTPGTNFRAWIYRILINLFRSRLRHQSRRPELVFYEHLERSTTDPERFFDQPALGRALGHFGDEVQGALDRLSPRMRLVIELVDVQDMTYREAAEILECPVGTIMSRLYRARCSLERQLRGLARSRGLGRGCRARQLC